MSVWPWMVNEADELGGRWRRAEHAETKAANSSEDLRAPAHGGGEDEVELGRAAE
jgi:hypothetical protein